MFRVKVCHGPHKGKFGDAVIHKESRSAYVWFPSRTNHETHAVIPSHEIEKLYRHRVDSILGLKESVTLQPKKEHVQIIGCKVSCGSVWCKECFVRKGGSKRIAKRLGELDWRATRQVVLTVDLKKFNGSGQYAFELLKEIKAVNQFIHNLKRTAKVNIVDWVWILEWHTDGAPHWHLFVETEKGKKGQIGNKVLLKHWKHGLVFESYIKSEKHWKKFTSYFGNNGYFDPKSGSDSKDKSHQLKLPEWAKNVTYRIRKTGAMVKKDRKENNSEEVEELKECEKFIEEREEAFSESDPKTYREILSTCGQSTMCQIRRGDNNLVWTKIPIPYQHFKQYPGHYIEQTGFFLQMSLDQFFVFLGLNSHEIRELERQTEKAA